MKKWVQNFAVVMIDGGDSTPTWRHVAGEKCVCTVKKSRF
jgi:hypothetical protein